MTPDYRLTGKASVLATDRLRQCITHANVVRQERGDSVFESNHLLLGMLRQGSGVGPLILLDFNVRFKDVYNKFALRSQGEASGDCIDEDLSFVFSSAIDAMESMSHHYFSTEHLLVGLTANGANFAEVLLSFGASQQAVTEKFRRMLGG